MRLVLVEQSAAGGFPWSSSHTEDRKRQWNYCLRAPLEIVSHTQEVFFLPLKKKRDLRGSRFTAKFPGTAEDGCRVPACCGSCVMITSCARATDDVSLLSGWSDMQDNRAANLRLEIWTPDRQFSRKETQLHLHSAFLFKMHCVHPWSLETWKHVRHRLPDVFKKTF